MTHPPATIRLAKALTYAGTLPLLAAAVLTQIPLAHIDTSWLSQSYSATIISFLSGIHWALYLLAAEKCPRNLFLTSNAVALLSWASLFINDTAMTNLLQSLCFLYLLVLDFKLLKANAIPEWFYNLRRNATIIVVSALTLQTALS
jgi:hypothetical protein